MNVLSSILLHFILIGIYPICGYDISFGGSSRLEDAAELNQIIEDKEHIKEELEDIWTEDDLSNMDHDELAFSFFTVHNTDDDVGLDGLELYKAIHHAKQHDASQDGMATNDEDLIVASHDKTMGMVDSLLEQFDVNEDGILDFSEFMKSFVQARHDLGLF